jgi:3-deoxy-8-phosphooctulonate synthase
LNQKNLSGGWRAGLRKFAGKESVPFIFKASYDKANRTSVRSYRGIGVHEGCEILAAIGAELKVPVTTDVHSPAEADIAGRGIDVLQIPAFLCRQTDLLRAAAETGRVVNVKKGQFLAPWDVKNIAEKLSSFGNDKFLFTERGTSFGYNNLVADFRSLYWMRELVTASSLTPPTQCSDLVGQGIQPLVMANSPRYWRGRRLQLAAMVFLWRCTKIRIALYPMGRIRFR